MATERPPAAAYRGFHKLAGKLSLDGAWQDVLVVERLLAPTLGPSARPLEDG